ncbi:prepilin-type N-terminal cleavage/methylation domain-containing protein [Oikeobacillus pervagus]|uniref:Prepilin-type N-terminal cleavage/methylation domain-containing protein n=1 Tax=Oikeobacillus pervagus TaxID=1325931 RepID=A0AAJ1SXK1_9BACI|nr:prepilin-type N-terminal cleavage/methylation domain-containing protein [Oikeobacillus pervagus]MDQ0214534.1 prepilin-type N-terminal cleavage/methylation domain-containing protein [Oikeobacillus pervagus]
MKMKKQLHLMARLKAKIYDKHGLTLVEILAAITIFAILAPIIWGVLVTGQKIYVKQSTEVQFRDDADYVVTLVMNEFYSEPFNYVEKCGKNCIKIIQSERTTLAPVEKDSLKYYEVEKEEITAEETRIEIIEENGKTSYKMNDQILETESDFTGSTLEFFCPNENKKDEKCSSGIIKLTNNMSQPGKTDQSLTLESEFGF